MRSYERIADSEGNALPVSSVYRQPYIDTLGGGRLLDWNHYPLTDDDFIDNNVSLSHALLNFGISYRPLDWLNLEVKYQYGSQQHVNGLLRNEGSYYVRDLINQFSRYNAGIGQMEYNVPRGSVFDLSRNHLQSHNVRTQFNLNQVWHSNELSGLIGVEASHRNEIGSSGRMYGYNPEILTFSQVNYLIQYPHFIRGTNAFIPQNHNVDDRTQRFISMFANFGYTFRGKYTFTLSGRRDASNQFGIAFNDRWNLLWSAGASWEASRESFYNVGIMPYLRVRATYGFSGNTDLARSAVTTVLYSGNSPYFNTPMAFISQDANPELGWEKIRMANFAADFSLKGNRISGSMDLFFKRGTDLFGSEPIDPTTGILNTVTRNISSIKGQGIDLEISSLNIDRTLKWETSLNLSYYDDKVVKNYRPSVNPSTYVAIGFIPLEGERLNHIHSYRWGGLDPETGDPIGFIGGEPSKNYSSITGAGSEMVDIVNHGSRSPLYYGSLGNTVRYKNFGLSIRLLLRAGYYLRNDGIAYGGLFGGQSGHSEFAKRWREPGDELITNVPSMIYPNIAARDNVYRYSETKVERGDHIRMQYVNVFYDITSKQLPRLPFLNMRLYVNMANLGLVWKASNKNFDPGYGADVIPPISTYSMGIRLSI